MATLIPDTTAVPFVDGIAVQLHLLRAGLGGVNVYSQIPDQLRTLIPAVCIHHAGGSSTRPEYLSRFSMTYQVWAVDDATAYTLSRQVATVLYAAWKGQMVTPYGHIAGWVEVSGFRRETDIGFPEAGRYIAVYDLLIRNPR
jgi:hypothetical protein